MSHQHHPFHDRFADTDIRLLALSRALTAVFANASFIVVMAVMYARTGSASWMSASLLASVVAHSIAAPPAGALVDRFDRRRVVVLSGIATSLLLTVMALRHSPLELVGMSIAVACVRAPQGVGVDAAIPELARNEQLAWANGLVAAGRTVGQVIGPMLGGLLVSRSGPTLAFALEAGACLGASGLVVAIQGDMGGGHRCAKESAGRRSMSAGAQFILHSSLLLRLVGGWSLLCVGFGIVTVAELPLAHLFGMGATGYGAIASVWSVGGLVGCLRARRIDCASAPRWIVLGCAACSVVIGATALSPWFAMVLATMLAGGFMMAHGDVADGLLVQSGTPDFVRGRVMAARQSLQISAFGGSLAVAPMLLAVAGPRGSYAVAAALCAVGTVVLAGIRPDRPDAVDERLQASRGHGAYALRAAARSATARPRSRQVQ